MSKEADFEDIFFNGLMSYIDKEIIEHSEAIMDLVNERSEMLATYYGTDISVGCDYIDGKAINAHDVVKLTQ